MDFDLDFDFDYEWDTEEEQNSGKVFILIIYDIVSNKQRTKLAKFLEGYGFRVQKSAFEAMLSKKKYQQLLQELQYYVTEEDSIRVYKMIGSGNVITFGMSSEDNFDEIILI